MHCIERQKSLKNTTEVIIKVHNEIINGKINIDANLGLGYFFNDDMDQKKFIPVYDSFKQGVEGKTIILNKANIEWISANIESDLSQDCVIPGAFNPLPVTIKLRDIQFVGILNLGYHKRLSDRLNDTTSTFISLLNVEYRGINRTVFINVDAILTIYDELTLDVDEAKSLKQALLQKPMTTGEDNRVHSSDTKQIRAISEKIDFVFKRS